MTPDQIRAVMPYAGVRAEAFALHLTRACVEFGITNPLRRAAFIAQLAHESGEFKYMEEIADGSAYEGRVDLGNTQPGDGKKFKGHGPIQITGRLNHYECGLALGIDLIADPRKLCEPPTGSRGSAWFFKSRGLNELADQRKFGRICKIVNGGYNGLDERIEYYVRARTVFT